MAQPVFKRPDSSLSPVVCMRVHVSPTLCVLVCGLWSPRHIVSCCFCYICLRLVYPMLTVSVPSVFSNIYSTKKKKKIAGSVKRRIKLSLKHAIEKKCRIYFDLMVLLPPPIKFKCFIMSSIQCTHCAQRTLDLRRWRIN